MADAKQKKQQQQEDHDPNGIRVAAWETGLCGCCTHCVPNCLMAWCLPCVSLAQISSRVGLHRFSHVLLASLLAYCTMIACSAVTAMLLGDVVGEALDEHAHGGGGGTFSPSGQDKIVAAGASSLVARIVGFVAGIAYLVTLYQLRSTIRARFQLPGGCCSDFLISLCCGFCSITQMATHVKSYKPGSCAFGPPDTLPAYQ